MDWSQSTINVPTASGTMWRMVVALGVELRASDYIGSQRALGSTYFTLCRSITDNFIWFNKLHGADGSMLKVRHFKVLSHDVDVVLSGFTIVFANYVCPMRLSADVSNIAIF